MEKKIYIAQVWKFRRPSSTVETKIFGEKKITLLGEKKGKIKGA